METWNIKMPTEVRRVARAAKFPLAKQRLAAMAAEGEQGRRA